MVGSAAKRGVRRRETEPDDGLGVSRPDCAHRAHMRAAMRPDERNALWRSQHGHRMNGG